MIPTEQNRSHTCIYYLCVMAGVWELDLIKLVQHEAKKFSRDCAMLGIKKTPNETANMFLQMIQAEQSKKNLKVLQKMYGKKEKWVRRLKKPKR